MNSQLTVQSIMIVPTNHEENVLNMCVFGWYFVLASITDHDVKQERQTILASFINRKVRLKS